MTRTSILLVEDEHNVSEFLQLELQHEGYDVTIAQDGEQALDYFKQQEWNLILLDWMIPRLNGLEVCRRIRKTSDVPIILLTARDYIGDKIAGLDTGADDYITKPFEIEELLARIRTVLRRHNPSWHAAAPERYQVDSLTIDVKKRRVTREGEQIDLTQREFDLLLYLTEHQGEVVSREQLLSDVWGYDFAGETNVVDVYIRYLRNKLDRTYKPKLIHTVRGVGYVLRSS
ncbi:response regulator transcription factor [Paenibacillus melissococcoides]|uniref:Response regulator transcription factor n=1 Tax=Paenibacillus melissococcoides TaxID=2912268 RepID=A0ABN8U461_9BACL|nr:MULTISPECIES: response regulator transcription factor [Paenibacillus]MEB9893380.1 response regulator transcription factor [Bacillus cereus]CAH8244074.1 response regulator transcription factor [Paenibacillus melissococcoides]CAH8703914.1 response regulator transcription factor [Paenibacillus melissococcoides]CAH8706530.1 response regulator transcription factor [Paenibacillus melissococcoides]GIO79701.1 DNA-binding response regulator [Paenibacillus dendritiformis]